MLKKFFLGIIFSLVAFSISLAGDFTPSKHVVLFYRVPDTVLSCQNGNEDLEKGRVSFEKMMVSQYSKRFIVDAICPAPENRQNAKTYVDLVKTGEIPLYVEINLTGQHTISQKYQNVFGAKTTGYAPAVDLNISEWIAYPNGEFHGYGPWQLWWSPGTVSMGMGMIMTENNARKNTKNAIRWIVETACTFNDKGLNKYTNPEAYENEKIRFLGDFEKWAKKEPAEKEKLVISGLK